MLVKTFIAWAPVEGLGVNVLVRLARFDQAQGNSRRPCLQRHRVLNICARCRLRQVAASRKRLYAASPSNLVVFPYCDSSRLSGLLVSP